MHCPFCARSLPDDAAFCYSCGARIEAVRPAQGVSAGRTLAGVGGPAPLATGPYESMRSAEAAAALDVPLGTGRQNTILSAGGVPGYVGGGNGAPSPAGPSAYPPGAEPTPLGPSLVGRRDAPGALSGLDAPVDRAPGPHDLGGGANAVPASARIAYADLAAARAAMQSAAGLPVGGQGGGGGGGTMATPSGAYPGPASNTGRGLQDLGAARESILEERARARQRDVEYGLSLDRENVAEFDRVVSQLDEEGTELVRRGDNARNVALVVSAGVLALGLAVGGYLMGRAGRDAPEDEPEEDEAIELAGDKRDPVITALETAAPADPEPLRTAEPLALTASPEPTSGAPTGPRGARKTGDGPSGWRPKPFGPAPRTAAPGGGTSGAASVTSAPAAGSGPPVPATAAGHTDLDSYAPYGGGAPKDHTPGMAESGVDEVGIAMVVKHHLPKVRSCLERRLKGDPTLSGRVEVQFTIAADGTVPSAFVTRDTVGDPAVGECIVGEMRTWRFPKPVEGSVNLIYPFVFPPRK